MREIPGMGEWEWMSVKLTPSWGYKRGGGEERQGEGVNGNNGGKRECLKEIFDKPTLSPVLDC